MHKVCLFKLLAQAFAEYHKNSAIIFKWWVKNIFLILREIYGFVFIAALNFRVF